MIEVVGAVTYVFAGWRFLLSPRYRAATEARWATMRQLDVAQDVIGGIAGVIGSILLPLFLWWSLREIGWT